MQNKTLIFIILKMICISVILTISSQMGKYRIFHFITNKHNYYLQLYINIIKKIKLSSSLQRQNVAI